MIQNKFIKITITIIGLYLLSAYFILPLILKTQIPKILNNQINYKTKVEKVEFNPFTLSLKLHDFNIYNKKESLIKIKNLSVDFSLLKSIHEQHISFKDLIIDNISINIVKNKENKLNILSLLKESKEEKTSSKKPILDFKISKTQIKDASISYTHFINNKEESLSLNRLNYVFYDLGTYNDSLASHNLNTFINKNSNLSIKGGFNLKTLKMYGNVKIKDFKPKEFSSLSKDLINFKINDTLLDISFGYQLSLDKSIDLQINNADISLSNFKAEVKNKKFLAFKDFKIKNLNLSYPKKVVNIDTILLNDTFLDINKDKEGILNLEKLLKTSSNKEAASVNTQEETPWKLSLSSLQLIKQEINYSDKNTQESLLLKDLELKANNISYIKEDLEIVDILIKNSELNFKNKNNELKANKLSLNTNALLLSKNKLKIKEVRINNKDLKIKQEDTNLQVNKIDIKITNIKTEKNDFNISNISIKNNALLYKNKDLLAKAINTKIKLVSLNKSSEKIDIDKVYFTNKDIKLDAQSIDFLANNLDILINKISYKDNYLKINNSIISKPYSKIILLKTANKNSEDIKDEETSKKKEKVEFNFDIGPLKIKDAKFVFQDNNLFLPFKTNMTKIQGEISELSSTSSRPTKIKLEGEVDKYGYTNITGFLEHKDIKELTNMNVVFKNLAIKNLNPYSSKFVGREVIGGKLSLDLKYNITKSNLDSKNSILISKIKLGKKIQSKDAADVPLDLGIALLEDSDGLIDINLRIDGDLEDPNFALGPIVWKVFTNVIISAVTSPFSFLASLIGLEGDDLKDTSYAYGSSVILPYTKEKLDSIVKIFEKRPNIILLMQASYDKEKDSKAIKKSKFEILLDEKLKLSKAKDRYKDVLEELYTKAFDNIDELEETYTIKDIFQKDKFLEHLENELIKKEVVIEEELINLANKRVENIIDYLTKRGIAKKRLVSEEEILLVKKEDSLKQKELLINFNIDILEN